MQSTTRLRLLPFFVALPALVNAQAPKGSNRLVLDAGSHDESHFIDVCARPAAAPIGVRPLGPLAYRQVAANCGMTQHRPSLELAPSWSAIWANSTRAAFLHDGPVWAGRGITAAVSGGIHASWKTLSLSLRPIAFWTQNLPYRPSRSVVKATGDFSDPWFVAMDRPYRFGDGSYSRIDFGESFLRIDTRWISTGISSVAQVWGPARYQPLVIASNAGGFPHVFVETPKPLSLGIGRMAARWVVGKLAASEFASARPGTSTRLGVGAVASFVPKGLHALELGASRFFHLYDTPEVRDVTTYTLPFSELFKGGLGLFETGPQAYNQLASVFARVAPKDSHHEIYGEYVREDHSADFRDAMVELDHNSGFMVGFRRIWRRSATITTFTTEASNGRISHLQRVRAQSPSYQHQMIVEGHTLRGIPLGAAAMPGGGGLVTAWERRASTHAWTVAASILRVAQNIEGGSWSGVATGQYRADVRYEQHRPKYRRVTQLWVEPGFGDVAGTNVGISIRVVR